MSTSPPKTRVEGRSKVILPMVREGRQRRRRSVELAGVTKASHDLVEPAIESSVKRAVTLLASGYSKSSLSPPKLALPLAKGGVGASAAGVDFHSLFFCVVILSSLISFRSVRSLLAAGVAAIGHHPNRWQDVKPRAKADYFECLLS